MIIRAGYKISFECAAQTPMLLQLNVHPSRDADLLSPDIVRVSPAVPMQSYVDSFDNRVTRLDAPPGIITFSSDFLIQDSGLPEDTPDDAPLAPVTVLPVDTLRFLLPSRYCDSDSLSDFAWGKFAGAASGAKLVQAICDFVHDHVQFDYGRADVRRCASGALNEGVGVCRDFAHLAIALCRAMNVPARYCAGYLGDIGVPPNSDPMDFSGWFEAFLTGRWYSFDARHNVPRIGRVVMAYGRDAADAALSSAFGPAPLRRFEVTTYEETGVECANSPTSAVWPDAPTSREYFPQRQ
jgi:transglutaminase-like putative cysteine protease